MSVRPIVCDWDATSSRPGTSANASAWRDLIAIEPVGAPVFLTRRLGECIPIALTALVCEVVDAGEVPLVLGGDHRLTHSVINGLRHRVSGLDIHHFDAHHDAHRAKTLNNYSFMYFMRDWGLPVYRYGVREPGGDAVAAVGPAGASAERGLSYLTIDLDYLDPEILSSVTYPLPGSAAEGHDPETLCAHVRAISQSTDIVGADLVEWCAPRATVAETEVVAQILAEVIAALSASADRRRTMVGRPR